MPEPGSIQVGHHLGGQFGCQLFEGKTMDTLEKLFQETVKDVYNAEHNFLKGMTKLSKNSTNPELKSGIEKHIEETKGHITRLDQVAKDLGFKPTGVSCKASQGLVAEAEEHLEEYESGPILDAAIIASAQKNETYEITSYGTLIAWAKEIGYTDAIPLFKETLAEEEGTDKLLTQVATKFVNKEAKAGKSGKAQLL
jgi:ferritin-like metal-binding protein YciE